MADCGKFSPENLRAGRRQERLPGSARLASSPVRGEASGYSAGESCQENAGRRWAQWFLHYSFRPSESSRTFYGVLNAAGPDLRSGPVNPTFRRKEATDVYHRVDCYDRRSNGDHGNDPDFAARSPKVTAKPRPGNRSWHLLKLTTFRITAQAPSTTAVAYRAGSRACAALGLSRSKDVPPVKSGFPPPVHIPEVLDIAGCAAFWLWFGPRTVGEKLMNRGIEVGGSEIGGESGGNEFVVAGIEQHCR